MERPIILQRCSTSSSIKKGPCLSPSPLAPSTTAWLTLADVCQDCAKCFHSTGTGGSGKRLIVQFFLPGTRIRIDIGNVKAAGVLCVLGISFGLGTYVLYKIYDRYFRRKPPRDGNGDHSDEDDQERVYYAIQKTDEASMGNQQSAPADIPVYYKKGHGVSLYKPSDNPRMQLRHRHVQGANTSSDSVDANTASDNTILKGNLRHSRGKNGLVTAETPAAHVYEANGRQNFEREQSGVNGNSARGCGDGAQACDISGARDIGGARDISELRIQVDESGFVEDDGIEAHNDELSNSLKGNFSPTSLYEKNREFSIRSEIDIDGDDVIVVSNAIIGGDVNNVTGKFPNKDLDRLTLGNSNLSASSVLLTPPSEDELPNSSSHQFMSCSTHCSSHSTNADVSEIHSEIADLHSEPLGTDEEREQMSPLPLDQSPLRLREQSFQKKLALKLTEVSSLRSNPGVAAESGNSSSCTSPVHSSGRRKGSLPSGDVDNSISGVSSPELEFLNSETTECPLVHSGAFTTLEDEIHVVEDEFVEISTRLHELSDKYSSKEHEPGAAIFQDIFQRYPSIRVRQQARGVRLSSLSDHESGQDSRSASVAPDDQDLSWDLENVLQMVYSEASDSTSMHNNGVVQQKMDTADNKVKSDESEVVMRPKNRSFNSVKIQGGSLYEDEFHLQLGSRTLVKGSDPIAANDQHGAENGPSPVSSTAVESPDRDLPEMNTSSASVQSVEMDTSSVPVLSVETDSASGPVPSVETDSASVPVVVEMDTGPSPVTVEPVSTLPPVPSAVCNIGSKRCITDYAATEWKGDTPRADLMRRAYKDIPNHCKCCHLRRIRGDNYCGIRGVVYQALVNALPPLTSWASKTETLARLSRAFDSQSSGIRQWTFATRLSYTADTLHDVMVKCLSTVYEKFSELHQHSHYSAREDLVVRLLNSDPECDLELMEGVKLLMLLRALDLQRDIQQDNEVPVFAWLMFARDTSEDVPSFVTNHLNPVGDSGGLEQVEMFLLGDALRLRIQVLRLQQHGQEDFVSQYPDDCDPSWPTVTLIAEDDRHYNVPVL